MSTPKLTTFALGSLAVLSLAGCAAQGDDGAANAPAASTAAGASAGTSFKDGDYSATGAYDSPGGPSSIAVQLTLKDNVVTALKVVPKADNPTAVSYETKFASGVNALVVGKKLTELNVTTVSGSSLTSQGFDAAITTIEGQAKA